MRLVSTTSMHPHSAVTGGACVLCGGPCRQPMTLEPVHANYPFMNAAAIEATWPPEQGPAVDERVRRRREDRMRRTTEDR